MENGILCRIRSTRNAYFRHALQQKSAWEKKLLTDKLKR